MSMEITYLAHHGILGQKWGVRRYQNKDGSLTKAGKKHYADAKEFVNKVEGNKPEPNTQAPPKPKKVSEMSADELQEAIDRMKLEKAFYDARNEIAKANPKQITAGEKFVKELQDATVQAVKQNAGKWGEKVINYVLGIDQKPKESLNDLKTRADIEKTKAEAEKLRMEAKEKARGLGIFSKESAQDELKRATADKSRADAAKIREDIKVNRDNVKKAEREKADAKKAEQKAKADTEKAIKKAEQDKAKAAEAANVGKIFVENNLGGWTLEDYWKYHQL